MGRGRALKIPQTGQGCHRLFVLLGLGGTRAGAGFGPEWRKSVITLCQLWTWAAA